MEQGTVYPFGLSDALRMESRRVRLVNTRKQTQFIKQLRLEVFA